MGCGLLLAMASSQAIPWFAPRPIQGYATVQVRRTDLGLSIVAAGRVDSAERTVITCRLEATMGMSWGSSTVLSLLPEGTIVKKGDVLCTLDAARFEEALRLQEIVATAAEADFKAAELNLEVAGLALVEFREGIKKQSVRAMMGRIALARADRARAADRLDWARRMFQKGYLSKAQVATEEAKLATLEQNAENSERALRTFEVWNAPKSLKSLEAGVLLAGALHRYETVRLAAARERLRFCREQVEACTIRAPHDGFLVYYTYPESPSYRLMEGAIVLRTQKLFYLPDLRRMEVTALLHETSVTDLQPGMRAQVCVEALPGHEIEGRLDSISALPMVRWWSDEKYFSGTITLRAVPAKLRPGMTASVKLLATKPGVLVIPGDAIDVEHGHYFCNVRHEGRLLRREVKTGHATPELIEITAGLEEGESVVLSLIDRGRSISPHLASAPGPRAALLDSP
jgi:HlyD family secretion protein